MAQSPNQLSASGQSPDGLGYSVQLRGADTAAIGAADWFPNGAGVGLAGAAAASESLGGVSVGTVVAVAGIAGGAALVSEARGVSTLTKAVAVADTAVRAALVPEAPCVSTLAKAVAVGCSSISVAIGGAEVVTG